jgi:acetyl esterase/lipase
MFRKTILSAFFAGSLFPEYAIAEDTGFTITRDIPYGDHERQKLDVYSPAPLEPGAPIIVFFHGGAWEDGDKADLAEEGKSLAGSGVIFVSANYRLFPDAEFPDFIGDAAAAVAVTLETFQPAEGQAHPVFLSGWSAGAYNAALLAYDQRFLAQHGIHADAVKGLIGLSGPYEGGLCGGVSCPYIFPEELRSDWNIAGHVEVDEPPALLIVGERDSFVSARHHEDLADAIRRTAGEVKIHVIPWGSHISTLKAIVKEEGEVRKLVHDFIADAASLDLGRCPTFPVTADGLGLTILISENGIVEECKVNPDARCGRMFDPRDGFLCISVDADARPTLTQIEGPKSQRVERVFIDGVEFSEGATGYPHLHLRDQIATGPSGSTYEIAVQASVGEGSYIARLTVMADLERPAVTFQELSIFPGSMPD